MKLKRIGTLMIVISMLLAGFYLVFNAQLIQFLEAYFALDNHITPNGQRELASTFYFGVALLLGLGVGLVKAQSPAWRTRIKTVFLHDPLYEGTPGRLSPTRMLIISTLVGLLLILSMKITPHYMPLFLFLYGKNSGVLDLSVTVVMIVASGLLASTVWKIRKTARFAEHRRALIVGFLILIGLFIFFAGEESSWGQEFIGWDTPAAFSGNHENETNLHNFFNRYFDYGYFSLFLVLLITLASAWLEFKQRWLPFNRFFLPHPNLIGLSTLIAFVAIVWFREQELLEEMMAAFFLFYSVRIFLCVRSSQPVSVPVSKAARAQSSATITGSYPKITLP